LAIMSSCSETIPVFQWIEDYTVGVAEIDQDHQRLFALAESMRLAMQAGKGKEFLRALLGALLDYTSSHFAREEALMERAGYPGLTEHRRQHDALRARVRELQERAASGEVMMTIEVAAFLVDWLKRHTITSDRNIAAFSGVRELSR